MDFSQYAGSELETGKGALRKGEQCPRMFSFWNRKGNKSPAAEHSSLPQPFEQLVPDAPPPALSTQHRRSHVQEEPPAPPQPAPETVITAVSTPHDAAVSEVRAKMLQVEQLSTKGRSRTSLEDPLSDAAVPHKPTAEPLFDPATGIQRGFFEPTSMSGSGDGEQHSDEAWTHLARIRELQSEIATMHMHMEGIGDGSGPDVEVDVDVDADTVPTQEEEEAAKREKEFAKLPSRFKGRSDDINAMMAKLDALSQAVNAFHALQPPPLNFESAPTSRENTHTDMPQPPGEYTIPVTIRTRPGMPPATIFGSKMVPDHNQIAEVLHDSPVSAHAAPLPLNVSTK